MAANKVNRSVQAILTEVLPYELPLIFTNDFRYISLTFPPLDPEIKAALDTLYSQPKSRRERFTIPYQYTIRKDRGGATLLSVMHPDSQLKAADFLDRYAETIIASCEASPASLRRPSALVSLTTLNEIEAGSTPKTEGVHTEPKPERAELSSIASFFVYRDYNLLGKFFDGNSYLDLEKRFSRLRTLDLSRCFYNIYTHSVTWAIKSKEFAKINSSLFAFEQQFDRLMQANNYNETNGILVGPELSRVFSEIILQRIDLNVIAEAAALSQPLEYGRHYEFKRYVDDFFVYANDTETLDRIEGILHSQAEYYKLYINEGKTDNLSRPFVTPLSSAKREIRRTIYELKDVVDEVHPMQDAKAYRAVARKVKNKTLETRLIVGEHGVGFHNVSSWVLSLLKAMIDELFHGASTIPDDDADRLACFERSLWSLFTLVFYIINLDLRVSSTFFLAQILSVMDRPGYTKLKSRSDWVEHIIQKEVVQLLEISHDTFFRRQGRIDSVETYNLLIIGAKFFGKSFTRNISVRKVVSDLVAGEVTYFKFISLKFVMLRDVARFSGELNALNAAAISKVKSAKDVLAVRAEENLLCCDLFSSPDLAPDVKRDLWKAVLPGNPSNAKLSGIQPICGFADWEGLRFVHMLQRRRLRPVYE